MAAHTIAIAIDQRMTDRSDSPASTAFFPSQVDLLAAAAALSETWSPRVVARVNDQYVKVARLHGRLA